MMEQVELKRGHGPVKVSKKPAALGDNPVEKPINSSMTGCAHVGLVEDR